MGLCFDKAEQVLSFEALLLYRRIMVSSECHGGTNAIQTPKILYYQGLTRRCVSV